MLWSYSVLDPVSQAYPKVQGRSPTCYSPVRHSSHSEEHFPFDLHVLSTPPAFVLSQNQTLQTKTPTPKCRQNSNQKNLTPNKTPKTGIQKPHPQTRKRGMAKNNKQKPPNTLLSSQTTDQHFATCSQATLPAYFRVLAVSTRWAIFFRLAAAGQPSTSVSVPARSPHPNS